MGTCRACGRYSIIISDVIGYCAECLRKGVGRAPSSAIVEAPPGTGVRCSNCARRCYIAEGERGHCRYWTAKGSRLAPFTGNPDVAPGLYYYDPHPTNCVAFPVCPAITGMGYPKYALSPRGERGYYNIAVFYGGCNLGCIFCQNWEHWDIAERGRPALSIEGLANAVNKKTTCVCFFGGDPGPLAVHALRAARYMVKRASELGLRAFRVCWETNGGWNEHLLKKAVELSLETGGIFKIDFKAWSPEIYAALSGASEEMVKSIRRNIEIAASYFEQRSEVPVLLISTLLIPGYIDEYEIDSMTRFVAEINRDIPYVFLAFHPDYKLVDLPTTSRMHMKKAQEIARKNGLRRVFGGNLHLLSDYY